ncbi:hypothetical protein [Thermonema rossianum]|uniref:hypothetical protein n=1 Tax=Thermonema rossianum TaxID=55505 RepID=UPI001FDF9343|nr:hypothetical protein [Thermonema rossianum]
MPDETIPFCHVERSETSQQANVFLKGRLRLFNNKSQALPFVLLLSFQYKQHQGLIFIKFYHYLVVTFEKFVLKINLGYETHLDTLGSMPVFDGAAPHKPCTALWQEKESQNTTAKHPPRKKEKEH